MEDVEVMDGVPEPNQLIPIFYILAFAIFIPNVLMVSYTLSPVLALTSYVMKSYFSANFLILLVRVKYILANSSITV